jgi:N-acetylneuraminic acid mutarotase
MNIPRSRQAATLLSDGRVLVAGGVNNFGGEVSPNSVSSAEVFNPQSNQWVPTGPLTAPRWQPHTVLLPNGSVLLIGQDQSGASGAVAEEYDPSTNAWSALAARPELQAIETVTLLRSGKVLVTGTFGPQEYGAAAGAVLFDPISNTWSTVASPALTRLFPTATLMPDGDLLLLGGIHYGEHWSSERFDALSSAEEYDPVTNSWTPVAPMRQARWGQTATLMPGGDVLVVGGSEETGTFGFNEGGLRNAELYDPATDSWQATSPPAVGRRNHTATLLPDGNVLVAGGWGDFELSPSERNASDSCVSRGCEAGSSAEIYEGATGSWSTTPTVTSGADHTASLLPDGGVLLTGGIEEPIKGRVLNSAEVFGAGAGQTASGAPASLPPPVLTNVSQRRRRWRESNDSTSISGRRKPGVGTAFSFTLNEQAVVHLAFQRQKSLPGCRGARPSPRRRATCQRLAPAGAMQAPGGSGVNLIPFKGRISASKRLKPGRYTVVLVATSSAGQSSAPRKLSFEVVG